MLRGTVSATRWITVGLIFAGVSCADDTGAASPTSGRGNRPDVSSENTVTPNDGRDPDTSKPGTIDSEDDDPTALGEVPEGFLADVDGRWKTLITGQWELASGEETYRCVRFTLPEGVSIGSMRALSPTGTHHTVLSIADEDDDTADGISECEATTNGKRSLLATGVGSNPFELPAGIGMELQAGQQLLLNLHLFNVSEGTIQGTSGTLIRVMSAADIKQRAEFVLAGPVDLDLPARETSVQRGTCTLTHDATLFALFPHMHQLGIHFKAVANSSVDGTVVLHDGDYSFDSQLTYPLERRIRMQAGDTVDVECTYNNTTDKQVTWGDSSLAEMCFAGLYRYPASDTSYLCLE
ncbi:MAG: hypothetical protein ABW321_07775 [Polyangiales bacterium]